MTVGFSSIDIIFTVIVLFFFMAGLINGFLKELLGKTVPIISGWIALVCYGIIADQIQGVVKLRFIAVIISFLAIFAVVFVFLKILQKIIEKIFGNEIFVQLDKVLGMVFGIFEGLAIDCILIAAISHLPADNIRLMMQSSIFVRFLSNVLPSIMSAIQ